MNLKMNTLTYTDAKLDDLSQIVHIYNSTIASRMVTADTEPVTVESRVHWFHQHSAGKRPLWLVKNEEDKIIGWVSFGDFYGRPAYDATAEISIYLDPAVRGNGYGRKVLEYCISKAPSLGIHTLLGFIFSHNTPSLKLFNHLGFEQWALLPDIAVLDGTERSLLIVGKRVASQSV